MAALDSQSVVPYSQSLPESLAMNLQTEQDNVNLKNGSLHCSNGAVVLPSHNPSLELGSGQAVLNNCSSSSFLQLQDDSVTAAAKGCVGVDVCSAECWPQFGAETERRRQEGKAVGEGGDQLGLVLDSGAAEGGGGSGKLPFSKQLITFSLFGKMPPKSSELKQMQLVTI